MRRFWRRLLGRRNSGSDPELQTEALVVEVRAVPADVLAAGPSSLNSDGAVALVDDVVAVVPLPALLFAGADRASLLANAVYMTAPVELQQVLVLLDATEAGRWFANAHGLFELERERRARAAAPAAIANLVAALRARHVPPSGWGAAGVPGPGNGYGDVTAVRPPPRRRRPRPGGPF